MVPPRRWHITAVLTDGLPSEAVELVVKLAGG